MGDYVFLLAATEKALIDGMIIKYFLILYHIFRDRQ